MHSINRTAITIKPKQPFIDWINSAPDDGHNYTLQEISRDNLVFLIPEYDTSDSTTRYIRKNYKTIFDWQLWGWITDEEYWPKNRTWKVFQEWFEVQVSSEVFDLVDKNIVKEEV